MFKPFLPLRVLLQDNTLNHAAFSYLLLHSSRGLSQPVMSSLKLLPALMRVCTAAVRNMSVSPGSKRATFRALGHAQTLARPQNHDVVRYTEDDSLTFAESFSTSVCRDLRKVVKSPETHALLDVSQLADDILALKGTPISSITLERMVRSFCQAYTDAVDKKAILVHLATVHKVDAQEVMSRAQDFIQNKWEEDDALVRLEGQLRNALSPAHNWLFTLIAHKSDGVKFLADLRADLLSIGQLVDNREQSLALRTMSGHVKDLLSHWFSAGFLQLDQITWQSSCAMLQKISDYEAVHPVRNWTDLKARVGPYRRCFVYTHRSMPGEPIVVLHVALTNDISASISTVVKHHRQVKRAQTVDVETLPPPPSFDNMAEATSRGSVGAEDPTLCTTAIFYSITSTQTGLQGIDLGNSLIKQAVKKLKEEFPAMSQFSTLSPVPGFRTWLLTTLQRSRKGESGPVLTSEETDRISKAFFGRSDDFHESLSIAVKSNQWAHNENLRQALETPLMRLCVQYLYGEKRRKAALDAVANFHLRNGATLWRLNWMADLSVRGLTNSCGIMVNYRYFLDQLEANSTKYQESHTIEASEQVRQLALQAKTIGDNQQ